MEEQCSAHPDWGPVVKEQRNGWSFVGISF